MVTNDSGHVRPTTQAHNSCSAYVHARARLFLSSPTQAGRHAHRYTRAHVWGECVCSTCLFVPLRWLVYCGTGVRRAQRWRWLWRRWSYLPLQQAVEAGHTPLEYLTAIACLPCYVYLCHLYPGRTACSPASSLRGTRPHLILD